METMDPKREREVWQRVRGEPDLPGELKKLAAREWADAAVYLMLSRQLQGQQKAVLRQLFEQEQRHGACLRGIYLLLTGQPLTARSSPPAPEPPEKALRRCCGSKLRAAAAYEALSGVAEYGQIFARMARQETEQCGLLLEVMGDLGLGK